MVCFPQKQHILCVSISAAAAQGVSESWSRCSPDIYLLLQRGQAGDQQQCQKYHCEWDLSTYPICANAPD